uniref:SH2 domain-containing protein 4B-like n=1 Tax=Ciona intestinalis TaxID=7719 RepID=UPI000180B456|nr:SH2 domain-containing protein 4B-like [Ciona intestinalis]|eukprot:XP_009862018.2 SH2 domain-containing protein 4B-like [Ciona intestinalis]
MLQQILRDMYVDPDILAELPEEQKEILFFKIREEQVRRYNEREKENKPPVKQRKTKPGKQVRIMEDINGEPLTHVFGENGEMTAEERWERYTDERMKAAVFAVMKEETDQALRGAQVLRNRANSGGKENKITANSRVKLVTAKLNSNSDRNPPMTSTLASTTAAKRADFAYVKSNQVENHKPVVTTHQSVPRISPVARRKEAKNRGKLAGYEVVRNPILVDTTVPTTSTETPTHINTLRPKTPPKVATPKTSPKDERKQPKSPKGQRSVEKETENIYESVDDVTKPQVDLVSNEEWNQQLRRFKEEDEKRKIRARRASIEVKRQSLIAVNRNKSKIKSLRQKFAKLGSFDNEKESKLEKPTLPPKLAVIDTVVPPITSLRARSPVVTSRLSTTGKPNSRNDVKRWFEDKQTSAFVDDRGDVIIPTWFHGIISRSDAESLLCSRPERDFLIRLSDKIWGYALSYKAEDRVKHFLIDASEGSYHFFGNDQIRHESLAELVEYHKEEDITYNGEILGRAVGQRNPSKPDYSDLEFQNTRL